MDRRALHRRTHRTELWRILKPANAALRRAEANPAYTAPITERRKYNAPQRRRQLADAAIELIGTQGARGLSHPRVDQQAGVPRGTTSFYYRTRKALLQAAATRLTELDVSDLMRMTELAGSGAPDLSGTAGLAKLVMYSATEPWLTRSKARYELALHASRDEDLALIMQRSVNGFHALARDVVTQWHSGEDDPDVALIDRQAVATLTFINGVMMSFIAGPPVVDNAEQLDLMIQGIITGIRETSG
jgi:DNA-binding transcriptional regulator YbjK